MTSKGKYLYIKTTEKDYFCGLKALRRAIKT